LPQFRALGESEDDDFLFDTLGDGVALPPPIGRIRRQLLLAHLIKGWQTADGTPLPFAQAAALATSLAGVMDEIDTQGADLNTLKTVVPAALAEHWQGVARFLAVIDSEWPAMLAAEGASNPAQRRAGVLRALADRLRAHPPRRTRLRRCLRQSAGRGSPVAPVPRAGRKRG
jgi:ATP-dependent helicase/nuclease subunit B